MVMDVDMASRSSENAYARKAALLEDKGLVDVLEKGGKLCLEIRHRRDFLKPHIDREFPILADGDVKAMEIKDADPSFQEFAQALCGDLGFGDGSEFQL